MSPRISRRKAGIKSHVRVNAGEIDRRKPSGRRKTKEAGAEAPAEVTKPSRHVERASASRRPSGIPIKIE